MFFFEGRQVFLKKFGKLNHLLFEYSNRSIQPSTVFRPRAVVHKVVYVSKVVSSLLKELTVRRVKISVVLQFLE